MTNQEFADALIATPYRCPFCLEIKIDFMRDETMGGKLSLVVHCLNCHAQWKEVHEIRFVHDINPPLNLDPENTGICDECGYPINRIKEQ